MDRMSRSTARGRPRPADPQNAPGGARDPEASRRAAELHHAMSQAPVGSRERRFLRRAAERAKARARRG